MLLSVEGWARLNARFGDARILEFSTPRLDANSQDQERFVR